MQTREPKNKGSLCQSANMHTGFSILMHSPFFVLEFPESNKAYAIKLTWNLEDKELSPNQVSTVTLTLNVSPTIQGITTLSFDAQISETEYGKNTPTTPVLLWR